MRSIFFLGMLCVCQMVNGQSAGLEKPEIGKPFPNVRFDVLDYKTSSLTNIDFKGKVWVIDFFTTGCSACFKSMPKYRELSHQMGDSVQFLFVGLNENNLKDIYDKYKVRMNLDFPVTFLNRQAWSQFDVYGVPHLIVLNSQGIVKAITGSIEKSDIRAIGNGQDPGLFKKMSSEEVENLERVYDWTKPFLASGNGGADSVFLYRSMISKWKGDFMSPYNPDYIVNMDDGIEGGPKRPWGRFEVAGYDLRRLYSIAYGDTINNLPPRPGRSISNYGNFWPYPILEVSDSSVFITKINSASNYYNYSLIVPLSRSSAREMQEIMQKDLSSIFGFQASTERRVMSTWKLVVVNPKIVSKLKSEAGKVFAKIPTNVTDFQLKNASMGDLIEMLYTCFPKYPPFIDATGISNRIDIYVEGTKSDFSDIRNGLKKNGFDLVKSDKYIDVVVIRDRMY